MKRSASEIIRNLEMRVARLEKQAKSTLRTVKSILRKEGLLDRVRLFGRSTDWEIEAASSRVADKVKKALRANGISTSGYTTGYGAEIIKDGGSFVDMGDWNDPSSRHHY